MHAPESRRSRLRHVCHKLEAEAQQDMAMAAQYCEDPVSYDAPISRRIGSTSMKVFISWSGRRSHEVAEALGPWLKKVIQSVDYFLSSEMERGVKWLEVLSTSLDTHSFGIICVTPGNANAPWINFEAGAL